MAKQKQKNKNYLRLDRLLSEAGYGTRSEVKKLLSKGVVRMESQVLTDPSCRIPKSEIAKVEVMGDSLKWQEELHYLLNKPAGVVTAVHDKYYPVVYDYLPDLLLKRSAMAVGRLDLDTTGLLLFTTDGQLNHRLSSPKFEIPKLYQFSYSGPELGDQEIALMAEGLDLPEHGQLRPAKLLPLGPGEARLIITEGIYHQVKRMLAALDREVLELTRLALGPLELDIDLDYGEGRLLNTQEIASLYKAVEGEGR